MKQFPAALKAAQRVWLRLDRTDRTIQVYSTNLTRLHREFGGLLKDPTTMQREWDDWYDATLAAVKRKRWSVSKLNGDLGAAKAFYGALLREQLYGANPVLHLKHKRRPQGESSALELPVVERLLRQVDVTTRDGLRDYAMLQLGYHRGMRVSEVCGLTAKGVEYVSAQRTLRLRFRAKGGQEHTVVLLPETAAVLAAYVLRTFAPNERPGTPAQWVQACGRFCGRVTDDFYVFTRNGQVMNQREVSRRVQEYCAAAGLDVRFHQLRHTFVTQLVDAGVDAFEVKDLARHRNIATTLVYVQSSERRQFGALAKLKTLGTREDLWNR